MMIVQIGIVLQLGVSLYLTHRVWRLQEEIEDIQMVVGAILMDQANEETPTKVQL